MGKVYRNRIPYAGGGNVKECTLAQYNTWKANGQLVPNTTYNIIDAPNLNETAKQISYDGGTATVWDKVESLKTSKQDKIQVAHASGTTSANGNITITRANNFIILGAWCNLSTTIVLPWIDSGTASDSGSKTWNLHFMSGSSAQSPVASTALTYYYAFIEL